MKRKAQQVRTKSVSTIFTIPSFLSWYFRLVTKERVLFPQISTDYCIGCGAYELACPTKPKAIFVTAKRVHEKAKKYVPKEMSVRPPVSQDRGFPF